MNNDKYRSLTESIRSMNEQVLPGWRLNPNNPLRIRPELGPKPYLGPPYKEPETESEARCSTVRTFWEDMGCTPGCGGTDNPCDSACGTYETILRNLGCTRAQGVRV